MNKRRGKRAKRLRSDVRGGGAWYPEGGDINEACGVGDVVGGDDTGEAVPVVGEGASGLGQSVQGDGTLLRPEYAAS